MMHNNFTKQMEIIYEDRDRMIAKGCCELTTDMDHFLEGKSKKYYTYICGDPTPIECQEGHLYTMRIPGSTCGYFITDKNGIINQIVFYKLSFYRDNMEDEIKNKYLGRKVVIAEISNK